MENPIDKFTVSIVDTTGKKHLGIFVGRIDIVVSRFENNDCTEEVLESYFAFQLRSGRIVGVEHIPDSTPQNIHSLKGKEYSIWWGEYSPWFPEQLKAIAWPTIAPWGNRNIDVEIPF